MACEACKAVVESPNVPHVIRICPGCGRELRVHQPGKHGRGIEIAKGEQFVIPAGWLKLSLNPLKSSGQFSLYGLQWFATQIHIDTLPSQKDDPTPTLDQLEKRCDEILKLSPLLQGLNLENEADQPVILERLQAKQESIEWWALLCGTFVSFARDGLNAGNAQLALWGMGCAERCRSMLVFKEHLKKRYRTPFRG